MVNKRSRELRMCALLLTGTPRSPDLAAVAAALGTDEVLRRVRAVSAS